MTPEPPQLLLLLVSVGLLNFFLNAGRLGLGGSHGGAGAGSASEGWSQVGQPSGELEELVGGRAGGGSHWGMLQELAGDGASQGSNLGD